ncbi:unnamed protein product [Pseudo-nitzschia multistriata]|uniref:Uncharacterized protein n=1 Tax=Pseudo-nitzschia multistriata TaxID=183589 RepID=A0A448ZH06_9STRA|nr:unnamed protein product [Pseudo-nitzschia multistriata]
MVFNDPKTRLDAVDGPTKALDCPSGNRHPKYFHCPFSVVFYRRDRDPTSRGGDTNDRGRVKEHGGRKRQPVIVALQDEPQDQGNDSSHIDATIRQRQNQPLVTGQMPQKAKKGNVCDDGPGIYQDDSEAKDGRFHPRSDCNHIIIVFFKSEQQ